MKKNALLLLMSWLVISCSTKPSMDENKTKEPPKTSFDYMFTQRAYPIGEVKADAIKEAIEYKQSSGSNQRGGIEAIWEFAGPINIGGRITDVEIPIDDANTYYIGAASGGVFKTTNAGENWAPIFDDQASLAIGDIEISKTNTNHIWVGTGEVNAGGSSLTYDGNGVYHSTDGGLSWTSKGLENVGSISKVLIDPNNSNTVFVGAMGPLFKNDENRGVFKTTNGGEIWEKVLFFSDSTGVIDMANHPTNSNILYAATWERIRRPDRRQYAGETSGLYKSIDGGETWQELTNGLPLQANDKGRISIAMAQSNPEVIYVRYVKGNGLIKGVYRTDDGGNSWTQVGTPPSSPDITFHWWFRGLFVDPQNENIVYDVDYIVQKSTDGGNSWSEVFPNVHVDQHALAFNATNSNEVLLGNDGGLYKTTNGGTNSTKFNNLPITQFYRFYVDPQNPDKIYGGSQDNGTLRTTTGGLNDWSRIFGGDGFQPLVDANNTNVIYVLYQRGGLRKSTNDGVNFPSATNGIPGSDRKNWDTPIVFDPQDSEILYYGSQRVWKTTNAAGNWSPISDDLTNGDTPGNLTIGTITSIDVSPQNSDVIIVGTDDGNVWVTQDSGENWVPISSTLPNLWVTKVLADREDEDVIYVTFSGYRYGENLGHIFKSTDAGMTWTDIGGNLPDIPVNDIVKSDQGSLFIATDVGVFLSNDEGDTWTSFGSNMPSVIVCDLHIVEEEHLLYAATYGRSAYKVDISETALSTLSNELIENVKIYPNPASEIVTISSTEMTGEIEVVIYDSFGRVVHTQNTPTSEIAINIAHFNSGIYYVKMVVEDKFAIKKLMVE